MPLGRKRNRRIWTLVNGDGHDFRCNACKRIIKCCSPTNITRHYANNHPEVLKTEEISVDIPKELAEPTLEVYFLYYTCIEVSLKLFSIFLFFHYTNI